MTSLEGLTQPNNSKIAHKLKDLCNAGGFPLAKWHSTHPDVLAAISSTTTSGSAISLDDCATKILGLKWTPHDDNFTFIYNPSSQSATLSKRFILSEVAQIFDSLGFISPIVIKAKMLLQELWLHKLTHFHPNSHQGGSASEKISSVWPDSQYHDGSTHGVTQL